MLFRSRAGCAGCAVGPPDRNGRARRSGALLGGGAGRLDGFEDVPDAAHGVDHGLTALLIHVHPTQNKTLGEAAMALAGKPLHNHG